MGPEELMAQSLFRRRDEREGRGITRCAMRHAPCAMLNALLFFVAVLFFIEDAQARFNSSADVATGMEYNDNIFFEPDGTDDFVFFINPTLRALYEPELGPHTFSGAISSPLQVFTQNTSETNFGDNILFNMKYDYKPSPRLSFVFQNDFRRVGQTRTGINQGTSGVPNEGPGTPTAPVFTGDSDLVNRGEFLTNLFSARVSYDYTRDLNITGGYTGGARIFIDEGGNSSTHNVGARATYTLNEKWSIPFGYRLSVINSRNSDQDIVHNADVGGSYRDEILPTLTLFMATGVGIRAQDSSGPAVINNVNFNLTKLWQTARAVLGVTRALTGSLGVSGASTTTSVFGSYSIQLTRKLTAFTNARASFYETSDVDFNTVQAQVGLTYQINSWLSSSLRYLYRQRSAGSGAEETDLGTGESIASNGVLLSLTTDFDLWPNPGLARGSGLAEERRQ